MENRTEKRTAAARESPADPLGETGVCPALDKLLVTVLQGAALETSPAGTGKLLLTRLTALGTRP